MNKTLKSVNPTDAISAYNKVQQLFFDYPTKEFSLNDLCSVVKISKSTANLVVTQLVNEGFLKVSEIGRVWRISCNQEHRYNITRKIPYHLVLVYESGIIEAIHAAVPGARTIILFGSYRKGDDNESSDIDIAVEVVDDGEIKITKLGSVSQLGYRKDVSVQMHIFSRNKINLSLFANIANGIVLEGFLEVRP